MAPGPNKPAADDRLLDEIIAAYLEAEEAGRAPDPQELLNRHPTLAPQLMQLFTNQEHFDRLAAPLRSVVPAAPGATPFPADTPFPEAPAAGEAGPVPDSAARCLGDYELLEEIGRGGMGVVFKARQRSLNRLVALKVIRPDRLASAADVRRFQYEAELVAQLDHPHIVPVYEVNEWRAGAAGPAPHYFSMKLMDGGSLAQALARSSSAFSPKEAARMVAAVARAVHHAHQRGIFHRDLKPSNLLLDAAGQPYVTDFGLAKRQPVVLPASPTPAVLEPGGPPEELAPLPGEGQGEQADQASERKAAPAEAAFTFVGEIVGTPSYMAPEQTLGKKGATSTQTDVHGLGAVLYTLLTGRPPCQGASSYSELPGKVKRRWVNRQI
jgi:serine/threonine-protein kinase